MGGRYRILSVLGEGGMGKVYLAEQHLGTAVRRVAIKTLQPDLARDPQVIARFHRETQTVIQLEHPNSIRLYDAGSLPDGKLFVAMEYIEGESLAAVIARGPLPASRVEHILRQVAGSLAEAHGRGIIHRDLKPENIVVMSRGGGDYVKVLDFGIAGRTDVAAVTDTRLTQQGTLLGTPPYMAPEQFTGQPSVIASDIYSLGVVTYEMLTGRLPYDARTPWEWASQHLTGTPIPLESLPQGAYLAPRHVAAVMAALARVPAQRPPTVLAFLQQFTGDTQAGLHWTEAVSSPSGFGRPALSPTTAAQTPVPLVASYPTVYGAPGTVSGMPPPPAFHVSTPAPVAYPMGAPPRRTGRYAAVIVGVAVLVAGVTAGAIYFLQPTTTDDRPSHPTLPSPMPAPVPPSTGTSPAPAPVPVPVPVPVAPVPAPLPAPLPVPTTGLPQASWPAPAAWLNTHPGGVRGAVDQPAAAAGPADHQYAAIHGPGYLTLQLGYGHDPAIQVTPDGTSAPELAIYVDDAQSGTYQVEVTSDHALPFVALPINPPPRGSILIDLDAFRGLDVTAVRFVRITNPIPGTHVYLDAVGAIRVGPAAQDPAP